jgi:glucose-1-phosphate adenylyltransferase
MPHSKNVLAFVMAGGEGSRLHPLTAERCKPAVPFNGKHRVVDFVLSNLVNSEIYSIYLLVQYKSQSLIEHIRQSWTMTRFMSNHFVTVVPPQMRNGPEWFQGTADSVYQNIHLIETFQPDIVAVFGADHIYRMDPKQMVNDHIASGAAVTVAGIRQPLSLADQFGVIDVGPDGRRIKAFREKPKDATGLPDSPDEVYASMGNYVFTTRALCEAVSADAQNPDSKHDMGGNIIPMLVEKGEANVYDFRDNELPGATDRDRGYWRDVGTLDSFYEAHMDLIATLPIFNLYNHDWPIFTNYGSWPPAKFVHGYDDRQGRAIDSMISPGVVVSGALVERSVISPNVRVNSWAHVDGAVIMEGVSVGRRAVIRNAIIDKNVVIPEGAQIGVDLDRDRKLYTVSDNGVVVIGKGQRVEL